MGARVLELGPCTLERVCLTRYAITHVPTKMVFNLNAMRIVNEDKGTEHTCLISQLL